jgi:hypothetical protein
MNSKIVSYDSAVKELKKMEWKQRSAKIRKRDFRLFGYDESEKAREVQLNKIEINKTLTIIHLHKQNRKLWFEKEHFKGIYDQIQTAREAVKHD